MAARALVIGIDRYENADWCLDGAVNDAIRFAGWAVQRGEVAKDDLLLLLAPTDQDELPERFLDAGLPADIAWGEPTEKGLRKVLFDYEDGLGRDAERLWFYYAGHGVAPVGGGPAAGPVVIPCDVTDLREYLRFSAIGLESWRSVMQAQQPAVQFFFVDACREVVTASGPVQVSHQLVWDIPRVATESKQTVLFSAAAGQRAREIFEQGLFGAPLLAGLSARGPKLVDPRPGQTPPRLRLLTGDLFQFVQGQVSKRARALGLGTGLDGQDARPYLSDPNLTVTTFLPAEVPTATLTVIIRPDGAYAAGTLEFLRWDDDLSEWVPRARPEPVSPLDQVVRVPVRVGEHVLRVRSPGYEDYVRPIEIATDTSIAVELKVDPRAGNDAPNLESARWGRIRLESADPLTRITVRDLNGHTVAATVGSLDRSVPLAPYRVRLELPGRGSVERWIDHTADRTETGLNFGPTPSAAELAPILSPLGIYLDPASGVFYPAKDFGAVATPRLGSLLAYAAWGARWPEGKLHHLRQIGVDPVRPPAAAGSVQVLVGDARGELADTATISLDGDAIVLRPLPQAPTLAQGAHPGPPGNHRVSIATGVGQVQVPVTLVDYLVSVVVVSREPGAQLEVQQYLQPADPTGPFPGDTAPPPVHGVRAAETAWRALEERRPVSARDLDQLGAPGNLDPLATVALGYRLAIEGRGGELTTRRAGSGEGVLAALGRYYREIPDVHVLAALVEPERAAEHFDRAAAVGLPLFGFGAQALLDHLAATRPALPEFAWAPVPGSTFTVAVEVPPGETVPPVLRRVGGLLPLDRAALGPVVEAVRRGEPMAPGEGPRVGERIAVVGRAADRLEAPSAALAWLYRAVEPGEVVVSLGRVVAVEPGGFKHDCPTMPGMEGGLVARARNGEVLGVHRSCAGGQGRATTT